MKYLWSNTGTVQDLLNLEPEELRSILMDHFKYDTEMVGSLSADELEDLVYDNISKFNNMDLAEFEEEWLPVLDKQTLNGWVLLVGPNHGWPVAEQAVPDYYINDPDWYEDHEISLLEDGGKLVLEFDEQAQFKMYAVPKEQEGLKTFARMCMSKAIEAKEEELTWDFEDDPEFYKNELIEKAIDGVVDELKDGYHHYICEYCDFSKVPEACKPIEAPVSDATMINYDESFKDKGKNNLTEHVYFYQDTSFDHYFDEYGPEGIVSVFRIKWDCSREDATNLPHEIEVSLGSLANLEDCEDGDELEDRIFEYLRVKYHELADDFKYLVDYNYDESLNEAEEGRQGFIVWQSGGSLGDKYYLEDKIFDTREDAQAAIKEWKASYGRNKSYYKPEGRIYKYKGKTMKEIRAEWNNANESLKEGLYDKDFKGPGMYNIYGYKSYYTGDDEPVEDDEELFDYNVQINSEADLDKVIRKMQHGDHGKYVWNFTRLEKVDESLNENFSDDSNKFIDFISQYIQNNESDLNVEVEWADRYKTRIVITPDYDDIYQAITFYSNGAVDVEEGDMGGVNNEEEFNSYEEFMNYFKATLGDGFDDDYDDEYDESLNEKLYPEYIDYFKNNYDPHYKDMVLQNIDLEHSTMVPTTPEEAKKFSNAKTLWNSDFVVGKCNGVICAPYALVSEKVLQKLGMTPDEFVDNAEELYIVNRKANDIGFYRAMAKRSNNSAAEYDDQARAKRIEAAKHRAMAAKIKAGYGESLSEEDLTEAKAKKPEILKAELEEIKDLYNSWGADAFYTVPYKQFKQEFPEFAKYVIEAFLKEVVDVRLKDYSAAEVEEMWQADDDRDRLIKESDWESLFNGAETLAEGGKVQWERLL